MVTELLGEPTHTKVWPAALVPHAGLRYSGRIAGAVFKRLRIPQSVIILGPKHTPLGVDWAVAPYETWSLPGHTVAADPELAQELAREIAGLELDAQAHQAEHAIEVELPFIARLAPQAAWLGLRSETRTGKRASVLRRAWRTHFDDGQSRLCLLFRAT